MKIKVGILTLTSCFGCSFNLLTMKELPEILEILEIRKSTLLVEEEADSFEILFVEGAVSTKKEEELLKSYREKAKVLVALGSCATNGNILMLRNEIKDADLLVYGEKLIDSDVKPVDEVVKVDYYLPGCPFSEKELLEFLNCYIEGVPFRLKAQPVCFTCRKYRKTCFLSQGVFCMGSITRDGCEAICTRNNMPCWGCRGVFEGANIKAFLKLAERFGKKELLKLYNFKVVKNGSEEGAEQD